VAGQAEDSVAVFQRNAATGGLAFTQVLRNGQNGVRGIEGVTALATSLPASGNQYLFVSGRSETLAVLGQGADGTWRMLQRVRNGAASVTGLEAPRGLTVSPDGQRLYIASGGSATTPGSLAFLSISQAAPPPITYSVQHANMESLTVSSAAGSDVVAAAGVTIPFTLDTGGGDDDVRLTSAPAATRVNLGAGGDTVSVLSTGAAVRIDGGLGDDAFTAKGRALGGTLTLNGDGHTTGDTLTFDSQNGTVTQVQQSATSGTLNVVGAAFGVSYATIENVGVRANPFASAGGPYTTAEGSPLTLDAGASTRPAGHTDAAPAYEWDVNGDGGFGDATGANPTLSWATLQALGVDDDGVYQVTVRYTTTLGGNTFTDVGVSTLTITNTAPTLTLAGPATVETGRVYTLNLSATDAGDDTARRWLVNWDDGSVPETFFGNPSVARHTFTAAGQHTIQATVTDEDGSFPDTAGAVQQTALAVDVVSVVRAISGPGTTIEGSPYRLALQAIGGAAASIQKWSINWGDGSVQDVAGNPAEVQHTYADDGAFTIAARVTEGDGAVRSAASAVNVRVQNAAPVLVSAASNSPLRQGDTLTLTVNATDAGPQDVLTYGFDFDDDGSFEVSGTSATVQKVYQAAGEHLLRVRVSDDDGAAAVRVLRIVVNNAAPVIGAVTVETSNPREASPVVFRVSASDRGGSADPLTYAFDFDNNGIYEVTSPASVVTHRFADNGTYTVGVKVRDGSGVEATSSVQVNVANVNPSIVAVATGARVKEGTPSTLTVIASDVAGSNDPLTYDFDLDNDGAYEISNATGSVSKTYPDNGTFTFSVRVRDDDGGVATVQQTVAVFNQAPVFELGADATLAPGTTFSRSGGFTDAGADTWTATVDYGDGLGARPLPLGPGKTFQLTRLASLPDGDHTIQVVITDDDGMRSVDAVKISVRTPAPAGPTEAELLHQLHVQQVQFLYRSLVGRLPTDRAAQVWVAALDAGTPLDSVGRAIARTPEFSLRMINDIYKQYLGRNARAAEVRPLLAAARLGRFERIRASVLGSAAYFKQRARNSRARFLNVLAGDVLGRSLDRRTKASLQVKLAQGVTRTNIALPLLTSQPGAARIVQRLVRKYGSARDNQRELATTLRLGASERDIILFMVLGRA
jgi:PKD repeat protein